MAKVGRLVKELMVQELTDALKERPNFFVASTSLLSSTETDVLRKRLRTSQAHVMVVKRTLGLQGMSAMKFDDAKPLFEGSVALVLPGEDIIPAAKLLMDFVKESQDKLSVRGGWIEGQLLDRKRFEELANLPPKPQLIAQLVGTLESPLADLIFTVEALLGEVAWVLEEASKSKPQPAQAKEPSQSVPSQGSEATPTAEASNQTPPPAEKDQQEHEENKRRKHHD